MLIDAPPTLLNTVMHKKHLSHFIAKSMNELAHKSPLISYRIVCLLIYYSLFAVHARCLLQVDLLSFGF